MITCFLEGSDLIGKTTTTAYLSQIVNTFDRHKDFTNLINLDGTLKNKSKILKVLNSLSSEEYICVMYSSIDSILIDRLKKRINKIDEFDKNTILYNNAYKEFLNIQHTQLIFIDIAEKTIFDIVSEIIVKLVNIYKNNIEEIPFMQGESKKFYSLKGFDKIALVSLKDTLYSFTYNKYGNVKNSDILRNKFWSLFGRKLNTTIIEFEQENLNFSSLHLNNIAYQYTLYNKNGFLSSYLGDININGIDYTIVKFDKKIPSIEIVWKKYFFGTMKHNLYLVDKEPIINNNSTIKYEGDLPNDIVRFDWRNPLPYKDECIPDDFAKFYINVENAKNTARVASLLLNSLLLESGFFLVDLCYFMNYKGTEIKSEITTDGMRIQSLQTHDSYDKDLWRKGMSKEELVNTWIKMYDILIKNENKTISGVMYFPTLKEKLLEKYININFYKREESYNIDDDVFYINKIQGFKQKNI